MIGLNHGMTGAVIALSIKNPWLAVPISFISHFLQDLVPHWDYGVRRTSSSEVNFFNRRFNLTLVADFLSAVLVMFVLALVFPAQKWLIWGCMIAAASPDLMWAYYRLYKEHLKNENPYYPFLAKWHNKMQWSQTAGGLYIEIVWFLVSAGIITALK